SEPIEPFRPDRAGHLDELARKTARWAADHREAIKDADPDMPAGIFNREADNWRPLLVIADLAGGEWPGRARRAATAMHGAEGDDGPGVELWLGAVRAIFAERDADRMLSADLVKALVAIEGRPWAEYGRTRKPLSQNQLARLLKPVAITPNTLRTADGRG